MKIPFIKFKIFLNYLTCIFSRNYYDSPRCIVFLRSSCKSQKMDDFADLLETNDLTDLTSTVNEGLDKLSLGDNPLNAIPSRHSLKSQTDSSDSGLPKTETKSEKVKSPKKQLSSGSPKKIPHREIPIELLTEFTLALSSKNWENSLKFCNEILLINPKHELANKFSPLIRRAKFELDEEENDNSDGKEDVCENSETETESDSGTDSDSTDSSESDIAEENPPVTHASQFGLSMDHARKSQSKRPDNTWMP